TLHTKSPTPPPIKRTTEQINKLSADTVNCKRILQFRPKRVTIGADHPGFVLKEHLKQTLQRLGHAVDDHGTASEDPVDYPPICINVARAVSDGRADCGIVVGGTGEGEQIAANKGAGIRAA